jgi:hypothetical protein
MANQSKRSTHPKVKPDTKAKAISNHKSATKPKVVAKPQALTPKLKAAKSNTDAQNNPFRANDNAVRNNPFIDHSSSDYDAYAADLSDLYSGFPAYSSVFDDQGFPDLHTYTNSIGDIGQNHNVDSEYGTAPHDHMHVNSIEQYGNGSFQSNHNGFSDSYHDSFSHISQHSHDESYVNGQLDGPNYKKALGSNTSGSIHINQEKQEHFGIDDESDEDYIDEGKTPKTRKDGTSRKPRKPRAKLLKWDDSDWKQLVLGIVWACGEAGLSIPFGQAAQLVHGKCSASALQQAILKLRMKQNAAGEQIPPLRMAWTRNKTGNDQLSSPPNGQPRPMIARRKPTRHEESQTMMFTFKRAYVEEDRALLPFPYQYDPEGLFNSDVKMGAADEWGCQESTYTPFAEEKEHVLEHSSSKQTIPDENDFHLNSWLNSDAMDTEAHEQDYFSLASTISTKLQGHGTTSLIDTLGGRHQQHTFSVLTSPVGPHLLVKDHVNFAKTTPTQSQSQGLAGLSNVYTSPQLGHNSDNFSRSKHPENQMVDVPSTSCYTDEVPTCTSTGFGSFDLGINKANTPVSSIELLSGESSVPHYCSPTNEDWSNSIPNLVSNVQLSHGIGALSTIAPGAPSSLNFDGQSSKPLGDGSSADSNDVLSSTYDVYLGQDSGRSSQTSNDQFSPPIFGSSNHGLSGLSCWGSSNNAYHGFDDYATSSGNPPASQSDPMNLQTDFEIPRTGYDTRNQFSAVNITKMVIPKGSKATARFM